MNALRWTWFRWTLFTALTTFSSWAHALDIAPYSAPAFAAAQAAGKPVALHFHADWCPTCRAQAEVLEALRADRALDVQVLIVDYDNEKELRKQHRVRAQSTLIVFKGRQEKTRLAGETAPDRIKAALGASL